MTILYRGAAPVTKTDRTSGEFLDEIKPSVISADGKVTFTNGTENILPNRTQCRRYGYEYDEGTGTCYAFRASPNLQTQFQNTNNSFTGKGNTAYTGVENTRMIGDQNEAFRQSKNNLVLGYQNRVDANIQNSLMIGRKANVTTSGSIVMGGNQAGDNLAERQTIIVQYGCQTTGTDPSATAGGTVSAGINNLVGTRFIVPDNSICYFHADTIAFRTAGSSGTGAIGDYYSAVERGVIRNIAGTTTIQRERDTIKTSGTVTNWRVNAGVGTGNTLALQCRGNNDMTIEWNITVRITQINFGVIL